MRRAVLVGSVVLCAVLAALAVFYATRPAPLPEMVWTTPEPAPLVYAPPRSAFVPGQTNVVLVIGCTVRADQTTPYGGPAETTPFLDELARSGTRFDTAIAQAPWTREALTAIVTGRPAVAIDMVESEPKRNDASVGASVDLLAERFSAAGYRTIGGTANPNGNAVFGFAQGFDLFDEPSELWRDGDAKVDGGVLVDHALRAVQSTPGPFFLQVLLVDAHFPYAVREGHPFPRPRERLDVYRVMLHDLDQRVERLYDGLAELGHSDDTLFVFVGDHGEGLFMPERAGKSHGWYLYPENVHVPLLMAGPGVSSGNVASGLVRQIDLTPTLLGLLGQPIPADLEGQDLSPLLAQPNPQTGIPRAFTDTWFRGAHRSAVYTDARVCQRDYDRAASEARVAKAARKGKSDRIPGFDDGCFDWIADPNGTTWSSSDPLLDELDAWGAAQATARDRFRAAGGGGRATLDDDTRRVLEQLGYAE